MVVFPNAKINLGLHILRRRADGYHDIETLMLPVDWNDILEVVPSRGHTDRLVTTGRAIDCAPEQNLVMKALRLLREVADFPPVDIYLHKIIPDGAGLGGGSSDAAFLLKAVNLLFDLGLTEPALAAVAGRVGADCPFFIYNRPAVCSGVGTEIELVKSPVPEGTWVVVSKPDVSVSTREAYSGVTPMERDMALISLLRSTEPSDWPGMVSNDFEMFVASAHPAIAAEKESIAAAGAWYASMSGSGAAVYGLFDKYPAVPESSRRRVCQLGAVKPYAI